jgi:spermidine synthase
MRRADFENELETWRLLFHEDGAAATVSVRELAGMRTLAIDGKVDASNTSDMLTQRLLGLLPALLHPDPRDVGVIGLGSGVTVASTLARGTVSVADVVDFSRSSRPAYFKQNDDVLHAEVRLLVTDGRSHLRLTPRHYDLIVSEPSNPWMSGVAALFTKEFFDEVRATETMFCQWAHTYDMHAEDLQSIVRTFSVVFPSATMWLVGESDLLLIGSNGSTVDLAGIARHWQKGNTPALLADVGIDDRAPVFALLSLFAGGPSEIQRYAGSAVIQHDDRMALEFSAPRAMYGRASGENAAVLRRLAGEAGRVPSAAFRRDG